VDIQYYHEFRNVLRTVNADLMEVSIKHPAPI
jgi:hypothetical protein